MRKYLGWALVFCGMIFSCAPFSRELMEQVDGSIRFQDIQKNPEKYIGKKVVFGGVLIETQNRRDETILRVVQTDLDIEKKPIRLDQSAGRFLVRVTAFLDPAIYERGREVTVLGEVIGKEVSSLGEIEYTYPVILATKIRLWEKQPVAPPYYFDWYWGWGPYPPRWYFAPSIYYRR